MPEKEERKLKQSAKKAGLTPGSKRFKAYVYGTEARIQKRRAQKRTAQKRMPRRH